MNEIYLSLFKHALLCKLILMNDMPDFIIIIVKENLLRRKW